MRRKRITQRGEGDVVEGAATMRRDSCYPEGLKTIEGVTSKYQHLVY